MIDIIIPAYNAHKTIKNTLISIATQSIKDLLKVYIVNDCSDEDYSKEVKLFKDKLDIQELKLEKNSGPGVARQYGLENSKSPYIVFCDSDDCFANYYALENLYNAMICENNDMAIGVMIEENDDGYVLYDNHIGCLHGKMYSRKYIKKNHFKFNDTRMSEDHSFNRLYVLSNPKTGTTDEIVYLYKNNVDSLTRNKENEFEELKWYVYNAIWTGNEAEKRGYSKREIGEMIYSGICYVFFRYIESNKNKEILDLIKPINECFNNYKNYVEYEARIGLYRFYEQNCNRPVDESIDDFIKNY